jgi:protein tyrosine phosphatase (PTP) superfamily phosphohydrolase (DUF442 family)
MLMRTRLSRLGTIVGSLAIVVAAHAAEPVPPVAGIPNFHRVTEGIYRGGQPEASAWTRLAQLGVRVVLDLRRPDEHSTSAESLAVSAAGMRYVNFPMAAFATPTATQLRAPLAVLDGTDPVFVHCRHGRDRTGTVIAVYRISRQHWTNEKALAEARDLGLHWYEYGMKRFIASYHAQDSGATTGADPARLAGSADSTSGAKPH